MELQTLRESNARLTTALQESAASVEQWKRQFSICRDENDRLRSKVGCRAAQQGGLQGRQDGGPASRSRQQMALPSLLRSLPPTLPLPTGGESRSHLLEHSLFLPFLRGVNSTMYII